MLLLIFAGISLASYISAQGPSYPNPGHPASEIGPGTFNCSGANCLWKFPGKVIIEGILNLTDHDIVNINEVKANKIDTNEIKTNKVNASEIYIDDDIKMSSVTIKGDGSVSTGLNADKLDGYDASDLLAVGGGKKYILYGACATQRDGWPTEPSPPPCPVGYSQVDYINDNLDGAICYEGGVCVYGKFKERTSTSYVSELKCHAYVQVNGLTIKEVTGSNRAAGWAACWCTLRVCAD